MTGTQEILKHRAALLEGVPSGVFIDGRWREALSGETIVSVDPSIDEPLREFAMGNEADVDSAVIAARRALDGPWARWRPFDRQRLILRFAELVDRHGDELAALDVVDMGLPVTPADGWGELLQRSLHFYATMAGAIRSEVIPNSMPGASGRYHSYTIKEPVGVVGAIVAWNGPRHQTCKKLGAVMATGCTLVMKPSEDASLTVLRMTELAREAGVPDGVINVVTGGPEVGRAIARHPGVDRVVFVGSQAVGRMILDDARHTLKRVSLELGGKAPNIVFADADLERAARGAVIGAFANSGQLCVSGSRLFVERPIAESFVAEVVKQAEGLVVGRADDPHVQIGPVISQRHLDRIKKYVHGAGDEGATLLTGGEGIGGDESGFFLRPTVIGDVSDEMTIAREEIFGPVLSVLVFDSADEVFERANDTPFGLNAGVWTSDLGTAHRAIGALRSGTVWVNDFLPLEPAMPHGGFKRSGIGREGGMEQIDEYLEVKAVMIRTGD
jgi:aldehyde dehydrogenase (NAD+)